MTCSEQTLEAAENGAINELRELIARDPDLVHAVDDDGYTPLHRAAYNGHTEAAQVCRSLCNLCNLNIFPPGQTAVIRDM